MTMPEQNDPQEQNDRKLREQGRDGHGSLITRDRPAESAIDSLFYEQGKLRADMDRLLSSTVAKPSEPAAPAKDKEGEKAGSDAGKPDASKPDAGKGDAQDAPKVPVGKRAANWTKTHPIATVALSSRSMSARSFPCS